MTAPDRSVSKGGFVPSTKEEIANLGVNPKLVDLAEDINKTVADTIKKVAAAQMKVGRLLLDAREEFKGDSEFGKWRKENTVIASAAHANRLMGIAKEFHNNKELVEAMSTSALMELLPAPPEVVKKVEEQIKETGVAPSVRETRELVKEANEPDDATSHDKKEEPKMLNNRVGKKEDTESTEAVWQRIIDCASMKAKMDIIGEKDYGDEINAYLLFGLDPLGSVEPSREVLIALQTYYVTERPDFEDEINEAYSLLKETGRRRR